MKPTPLAKVLLVLFLVLPLIGAGVYLYKNRGDQSATVAATEGGQTVPSQDQGIFNRLLGKASGEEGAAPQADAASPNAKLGSKERPLTVSLVSWHGYVGGLLANGGLTTQPGSVYDQAGLQVRFLLDDNLPTITEHFEPGTAQCIWRTTDFWAQEHPALRKAGLDGRAVMVVDNSRGGDAIIARQAITKVEDLAGKTVATTEYTPSHMLTLYAIANSSLSARQKQSVQFRFFETNDDARAAFEGGSTDALTTWEPDTSLALHRVQGAHVVFSTAQATNLIYDEVVCNQKVIQSNPGEIQTFVRGWLDSASKAKADPNAAAAALVSAEPMFAKLEQEHGRPFILELFKGILWTDLADNIRILGLAGGPNHHERVYKESDAIWRSYTNLMAGVDPVPVQDSFDYQFVRALMDTAPQAKEKAAVPEVTFTTQGREAAKTASITKPVVINFETGKADLTERAKQVINTELVPLLDAMGRSYFEVSGNTDSTGGRVLNMALSLKRAQAVVGYLSKEWEFPEDRFKVVGNGPDKPLCNEASPEEGTLEECRARNRTTRVAVLN